MDKAPNQSEDDGASPFERFENFARRLFDVPKREIDEHRAKDGRGPKTGNGAEPKTTAR